MATPSRLQGPTSPGAAEPPEQADLDTQVSWVEQRLIARERRVIYQLRGLGRRVSGPRALLPKLAGGALVAAGLVWTLRRHRAPAAAQAAAAPQAASPGGVTHLLLSVLPMVWPLLPARWRGRVSPATASTVLGVAIPWISRWMSPSPRATRRADLDRAHR